ARLCSFSVACAAPKQVLARRRYSSALLVTTETPEYKRNSHALRWTIQRTASPKTGPARSDLAGPGSEGRQYSQDPTGLIPRALFQLASVKLVPCGRANS